MHVRNELSGAEDRLDGALEGEVGIGLARLGRDDAQGDVHRLARIDGQQLEEGLRDLRERQERGEGVSVAVEEELLLVEGVRVRHALGRLQAALAVDRLDGAVE